MSVSEWLVTRAASESSLPSDVVSPYLTTLSLGLSVVHVIIALTSVMSEVCTFDMTGGGPPTGTSSKYALSAGAGAAV